MAPAPVENEQQSAGHELETQAAGVMMGARGEARILTRILTSLSLSVTWMTVRPMLSS